MVEGEQVKGILEGDDERDEEDEGEEEQVDDDDNKREENDEREEEKEEEVDLNHSANNANAYLLASSFSNFVLLSMIRLIRNSSTWIAQSMLIIHVC